jgi:uncharacterized protein
LLPSDPSEHFSYLKFFSYPKMDDLTTPETTNEAPQEEAALLTPAEARVLACLVEKEATTPDYYPMTLNALVAACNQKSNRFPISEWDDRIVDDALGGLRRKRLATMVHLSGSRVPKFRHQLENVLDQLKSSTKAVLVELMLRGVQTMGELRTNCERLHKFPELADTESAVSGLLSYPTGPLVREIPPGGGKRVKTYVHLLCGEPDVSRTTTEASMAIAVEAPPPASWKADMEDKVNELEARIAKLEAVIAELGG